MYRLRAPPPPPPAVCHTLKCKHNAIAALTYAYYRSNSIQDLKQLHPFDDLPLSRSYPSKSWMLSMPVVQGQVTVDPTASTKSPFDT